MLCVPHCFDHVSMVDKGRRFIYAWSEVFHGGRGARAGGARARAIANGPRILPGPMVIVHARLAISPRRFRS